MVYECHFLKVSVCRHGFSCLRTVSLQLLTCAILSSASVRLAAFLAAWDPTGPYVPCLCLLGGSHPSNSNTDIANFSSGSSAQHVSNYSL